MNSNPLIAKQFNPFVRKSSASPLSSLADTNLNTVQEPQAETTTEAEVNSESESESEAVTDQTNQNQPETPVDAADKEPQQTHRRLLLLTLLLRLRRTQLLFRAKLALNRRLNLVRLHQQLLFLLKKQRHLRLLHPRPSKLLLLMPLATNRAVTAA